MTLYVNGQAVDPKRIEQEIERMRPRYEEAFAGMPPEQRQAQLAEWARENVIESMLFVQAAEREFPDISDANIDAALQQAMSQENPDGPLHHRYSSGDAERQRLCREAASHLRSERLMEKIAAAAAEPKEKDIRRYYQRHTERFTIPEMVRAAHIVKHPAAEMSSEQQKEQMEALLAQLQLGADFAAIAGEHSACPESGGDLGYFPRGRMVPAFEEVVFGLRPGQISGVFATEFGWHIVKVLDRRPATPCPLEQVRRVIVKELTEKAREKAIEQFLDRQRKHAVVQER